MKSLCIKTNNKKIIDYLLKRIETIPLKNIYYINKHFKNYENIILHYKGENQNKFYKLLSEILARCIIEFYEENLFKNIINYNYFYFDNYEKEIILAYCIDFINEDLSKEIKNRYKQISINLANYISKNKNLILDGFIYFRIPKYLDKLNFIVDYAVNKYIIEKEYNEFINMLKIYINSKEPNFEIIHLIYTNGEPILLDKNKNIISLNKNNLNAKYLSDISFSSNDYALNTLLNLIPKKIQIHLIGFEDDFIKTLKLIFEKRIVICTNCNICKTYKILNNVKN